MAAGSLGVSGTVGIRAMFCLRLLMAPDLPRRLKLRLLSPTGTALCLCGIWLCLIAVQLSPCFEMNPDSGRYLALARSLAEGRGYTLEGRPCRSYPPGFPLMLSTVHSPERHDFRPEKLIVMLTGLGAMLGSWWLLSHRYDGRRLLMLSILVAVSPALVRYCIRLRSDVPFFFFSVGFMAAADLFWRSRRLSWRAGVISAAALAAAAMTRAAGLVFYLAAFVWLVRSGLKRGQVRRCVVFAVVMTLIACPPALGWILWVRGSAEGGGPSYGDYAQRGILKGVPLLSARGISALLAETRSVPSQLTNAAWTMFGVGGHTGGALAGIVLVPLVLVGLLCRMRRPDPSDFCFCGYGLLILFWPDPQGTRLWLPVLPLLLGYLADGVDGFGRLTEEFPRLMRWGWLRRVDCLLGGPRERIAWWGALVLLVVGVTAGTGRAVQSWLACRDAVGGVYLTSAPRDVARFLNDSQERPIVLAYWRCLEVAPAVTNPDATVVQVPVPQEGGAAVLLVEMQRRGITHLVIERKIERPPRRKELLDEARRLLMANPHEYPLVSQTQYIQVFKLPTSGR